MENKGNIENTFVINLKECKKRLASISKNLHEHGIDFERWDATKGSTLGRDEMIANTSPVCRNFLCNNGTIGCHISHMRLWKQISEKYGCEPERWFLVFEDDAKVDAAFMKNIAGVMSDLKMWKRDGEGAPYPEFINLACNKICSIGTQVTPHIHTSYVVTTTRAYLISGTGACKLADKIRVVNYHVDVYLTIQQLLDNTLAYYGTKNYVGNNDALVSTISSNTFPRIVPDLLNVFLVWVEADEYHILYNSPVLSFVQVINVNVMVLLFIFVIAWLVAKGKTILACVYILAEICYYWWGVVGRKAGAGC